MTCNEVQNLMPLYAGEDLASLRERESIEIHLEECELCRYSAREWAESQQLFQAVGLPEFDAEFFDGIRSDVLREINPGSSRQSSRLPFLFAGFRFPLLQTAGMFSRPLAIATTVCLLFLAGALTFGVYQSSRKLRAAAVGSGVGFVGTAQVSSNRKIEVGQTVFISETKGRKPSRTPIRSIDRPSPNITKESPVNSAAGEGEIAASAARDSVVRIEIKTRDPNVRIIWLKPQVDTTTPNIHENR